MLLSIIMPVYNERATIEEIVRRVMAVDLGDVRKELVIVDDGSRDGTRDLLKQWKDREGFRILLHERNHGKGRAVRTGLQAASGDILIIQDADLEYDPNDYPAMIQPILQDRAHVVYGSRFKGAGRAFLATHYYGNKFITFVANVLYNTNLTDIETCYKAFRRDVFRDIRLKSDSFDIEPEITAKVFKKKFKVFEVPISYDGRDFEEGKKITWRDGFRALWTLFKYRFVD